MCGGRPATAGRAPVQAQARGTHGIARPDRAPRAVARGGPAPRRIQVAGHAGPGRCRLRGVLCGGPGAPGRLRLDTAGIRVVASVWFQAAGRRAAAAAAVDGLGRSCPASTRTSGQRGSPASVRAPAPAGRASAQGTPAAATATARRGGRRRRPVQRPRWGHRPLEGRGGRWPGPQARDCGSCRLPRVSRATSDPGPHLSRPGTAKASMPVAACAWGLGRPGGRAPLKRPTVGGGYRGGDRLIGGGLAGSGAARGECAREAAGAGRATPTAAGPGRGPWARRPCRDVANIAARLAPGHAGEPPSSPSPLRLP